MQESIHSEFISECFVRLKTSYDTLQCLTKDSEEERENESKRMIRVLTVLQEYINECDDAYTEERALLPLARYIYTYSILPLHTAYYRYIQYITITCNILPLHIVHYHFTVYYHYIEYITISIVGILL